VAALEQSEGAFLMEVSGPTQPGDLGGRLFAAVPGGGSLPVLTTNATLVVGPEGGWGDGELPEPSIGVGLGRRTLRTETAAIVFATLALDRAGRLGPRQ
jgi:16S rRNA U1498 N3-methylase RsmE